MAECLEDLARPLSARSRFDERPHSFDEHLSLGTEAEVVERRSGDRVGATSAPTAAMTHPISVSLTHDGRTLAGSLYDAGADAPWALLVHGFGGSRIGPRRLFALLADRLRQAGVTAVAFDRLGHGESDGDFFDITVSDEIEQVLGMRRWAEDRAGGPIHLVAHSLGGVETALSAARRPDGIASLALWAPAAVSADDVAEGTVHGQSTDALDTHGRIDIEGLALGPAFVDDLRGTDPYDGIDAYTGPARIHQGLEDDVVPVRYSRRYAEIWGDPDALLVTYPDAGHTWSALPERETLIGNTVADIVAAGR